VHDHVSPGNTTVSVSAYVAHRDPDVFPDPKSFISERWLESKARDLQESFIAFSAGREGLHWKEY
jgi:cytochrome P450